MPVSLLDLLFCKLTIHNLCSFFLACFFLVLQVILETCSLFVLEITNIFSQFIFNVFY